MPLPQIMLGKQRSR